MSAGASADTRRLVRFQKGPVFANVVLADEINRATPKTQSALLEAMQEQTVTVGGTTYLLESPFIVLATQNPIEMEGTYPLPEAQLDRFFFKIALGYPSAEEIVAIVDRTTAGKPAALSRVMDGATVTRIKDLVREVPIAAHVKDYAIRLALATRPGTPTGDGARQPLRALRGQPAGPAEPRAGRQGEGPLRCPYERRLRRRESGLPPGPPPPGPPQLRRRGGGDDR